METIITMRSLFLLVSVLSACGQTEEPGPQAADLTDPQLQLCVNQHLGYADDSRVSVESAATLQHLDCIDLDITSIDGLHHYTGLETLSLWENQIVEIESLAALTNLKWLELGSNAIVNIDALGGINTLTRLGLSSNKVSNINALGGLSELQWLTLDDNQITDSSALSGLDSLTWLTIDHNQIADTSTLEELSENGADVYADYQSEGASGPPAPDMTGEGISGQIDASIGTLLPLIHHREALEFDLAVGGTIHTVRTESAGDLYVRGAQILLDRGGDTFIVGQTDGATAQLCENGESCSIAIGVKMAPEAAYDGLRPEPIVSLALNVHPLPSADVQSEEDVYGSADVHLVDLVLASPNQLDAGSCLFMTTTGAMELLIHQDLGTSALNYDGDTDLSERFLMAAYQDVPTERMRWWLTDTVYTYNYLGGSMLNRDYPFTAGYVRETSSGSVVPCEAGDNGAYYSCSYNWFDERPDDWEEQLVNTPSVERTIAFADPDQGSSSQWNVALMDDEDIEKIKYMLRTRRAPVVVIYNHYLYWHADLIVGYDDTVQTDGCPMVEDSMAYFDEQGSDAYTRKIEAHMDDIGDCTNQGIFYVRDSIYDGDSDEETYDYGGFSEQYSTRIIERTYNWVKFLSNHAYSVHRK
jgi:hypothetical protein